MIRMEYPKANIEGLTDREKIYALKKQLDTLTNNVQLVLESIDGDLEGVSETMGTMESSVTNLEEDHDTRIDALEVHDYIVEQGTSGIWTFRKWNSGIVECWGIESGTANHTRTWAGLSICDAVNVSFPTNLFVATPTATMTNIGANSSVVFNGGATTQNQITFQLGRGSNANNIAYAVSIIAKGRWK